MQANVSGDLIIARTSRVQLFTCGSDKLSEPTLDIHMNIFEFNRPRKITGIDLGFNRCESLLNLLEFGCREHAH